jgi:uncharacterized membrane protein
MKVVVGLLVGHVLALAFGLAGILIALPNPQLWAGSPYGATVFAFGMQYAGSLHILLGAATLLAYGLRWLGGRRTLIFFLAATSISLASELIGTGTGWPFGNYSYTSGLGLKVAERVPFTIPLSWFYMGLTSYLLAQSVVVRAPRRWPVWISVALGAWLLLAWDLVLDPAMAHESLPLKFWVWHESGPYFGMPVKNLAAWFATGLVFMGLSSLLWRDEVGSALALSVPLAMYAANFAFAAGLSASVGLWQPIPLALAFGLVPVGLLWWRPFGLVRQAQPTA